jgi:hypothetical protein
MTEDVFREKMCQHMEDQTKFLSSINEAVAALRVLGRFIGGLIALGGALTGAWNIFHK